MAKATELPPFVGAQEYMKLANQMYGAGNERYTANQIAQYDDPNRDTNKYPDTNMMKDLMNTGGGFQQQHSLGINGGNTKVKYAFNTNYFDQTGLINNMNYARLTIRLNTDVKISDQLHFSADASVRSSKRSEPSVSNSNSAAWALTGQSVAANPLSVDQYTDGTWALVRGSYNPVRAAQEGSLAGFYSDLYTGNFKADFEPIKGLIFSGLASLKMGYNNSSRHNTAVDYYTDFPTNSASLTVGQNEVTKDFSKSYFGNYQGLANYTKNVGKNHFGALLGISYLQTRYDYLSGYRNGLPNTDIDQINAGSSDGQNTSGTANQYGLFSLFGRLNYSYSDKYLLEINIRRDGSSRISSKDRYGIFPSFSAGWRISEENFMKDLKYINNLKMRASWGQLGNDNSTSNYPYQTSYSFGGYPFGGVMNPTAGLSVYPNSGLKWETTTMSDIGIDAGVISNKLTMTFDYYVKNTTDILYQLPIPGTVGLDAPVQNAGKVKNNGWELGFNYHDKIGKDLRYNAGFMISDVINKIVDLKGADKITTDGNNMATGMVVGKPIGSYYGYQALGFYQTQQQLTDFLPYSSNVALGDIMYKKQDNTTASWTSKDMVYLGSNIPRYTYSFNLGASYKGFDLATFFQGVGKVDVYTVAMERAPVNSDGNFLSIHEDAWTSKNTGASFPRLSSGQQNYQSSSFWLKSGAYLRLKNLQIGYTLPPNILTKLSITKCRFYVSGSNLLTFTSLPTNIDPESPNDNRYYPQTKIYTVGMNVEF